MDLARLQTNWTNLGKRDPLWAILGSEQSEGVPWDHEAFFQTGVDFCNYVGRYLRALGLDPRRQRALDFGCGYGRLSQALARWFDEVVGVDIASTMIEGARRIDRSDGRCRFLLNERADLSQWQDASFDFVISALVLQHMRSDYAMSYVREFLRVLRPGGVAFFQSSSVPRGPRRSSRGPVTAALSPLALGGLRGSLVGHPGFLAVNQAEWQWYTIDLHNGGEQTWCAGPGPHRVQVASRWHAGDGVPGEPALLHDLPHDVEPGRSVRMLVPVRAPGDPMRAVLVFQVVVAGAWIELTELAPARVLVQIEACGAELLRRNLSQGGMPPYELPTRTLDTADSDEASIEIHGTPVHKVVETIRDAGGEVIDVAEDVWAGPAWLSAHYVVRKL